MEKGQGTLFPPGAGFPLMVSLLKLLLLIGVQLLVALVVFTDTLPLFWGKTAPALILLFEGLLPFWGELLKSLKILQRLLAFPWGKILPSLAEHRAGRSFIGRPRRT
jgi:hypothetical protein